MLSKLGKTETMFVKTGWTLFAATFLDRKHWFFGRCE